eukprot:1161662-Pelagomonas_calceolata.AAC.17
MWSVSFVNPHPSLALQCDQLTAGEKVLSGGHPAHHQRDLHPQVGNGLDWLCWGKQKQQQRQGGGGRGSSRGSKMIWCEQQG